MYNNAISTYEALRMFEQRFGSNICVYPNGIWLITFNIYGCIDVQLMYEYHKSNNEISTVKKTRCGQLLNATFDPRGQIGVYVRADDRFVEDGLIDEHIVLCTQTKSATNGSFTRTTLLKVEFF